VEEKTDLWVTGICILIMLLFTTVVTYFSRDKEG